MYVLLTLRHLIIQTASQILMINDRLTQGLRNLLKPYKLILDNLQKQCIQQNMGPSCCLNSFDLGTQYIINHREEIANKIGFGGSLLQALNFVLDQYGMKLLTSYQLTVHLQLWQQLLIAKKGVETIINADCTLMIIITYFKTIFTNTPQYMEVVREQDGYDQFYGNMVIDEAKCNAAFDESNIMQSTHCTIRQEEMQSSGFLSASETYIISTEDAQKSKDKRKRKKMEKVVQKPGLTIDSGQKSQPNVIEVIEELSRLKH